VKHHKEPSLDLTEQNIQKLKTKLVEFGIELSPTQQRQLNQYALKIIQWNQKINLISKKDIVNVVTKHFLESIAFTVLIDFPHGSKILDLGSGAGFPGIPLKIVRPDLAIVLLESKRKRSLFLQDVVNELVLPDIEIFSVRAELLPKEDCFRGVFNFVLARAVARLAVLWSWSLPLLQQSGVLIAMKGGELTQEITGLKKENPFVEIREIVLPKKLSPLSINRKLVTISRTQ